MTGRENLVMVARLYGQVAPRRPGRAPSGSSSRWIWWRPPTAWSRTYSGGMRRRLDLGASLVGSPRLLLLDEPTTGLDPGSRNEVWDAIRDMSRAGTDIVLTTQYLDEADHLAAYIVIIDEGRVIAQGTPERAQVPGRRRHGRAPHRRRAHHAARGRGARRRSGMAEPSTDPATRRCSIAAPGGSRLLPVVVRALDDAAVAVEDIALAPAHPRRGVPRPHRHARPTTTTEGGRSMTMDLALDPPRQSPTDGRGHATRARRTSSPRARWRPARSRSSCARRRCIVAGTAQGVLFLLIFRYVFGGAVAPHRQPVLRRLPGARASSSPACCSRAWARPAAWPTTSRAGCSTGCAACPSGCSPSSPAGWAPTRRSSPGAWSS